MNLVLQLVLALAAVLGFAPEPSKKSAPIAPAESYATAKLFARAEGDTVRLVVLVTVEPGWHAYSGPTMADVGPEGVLAQPTELALSGEGFTWGDWRFPKPEIEVQDFGTPLDVNIHRGTFPIQRVGKRVGEAKLETLSLAIKGQTCSDGEGGVCVPFQEKLAFAGAGDDKVFAAFSADLTATPKPASSSGADAGATGTAKAGSGESGASGATKSSTSASSTESAPTGSTPTGAKPATDAPAPDEDDEPQGLAAFLISAVFWGLFTLAMPCTYPMIPITISYFTKQATARKTSTLPLSLAYGAGIVLIFVLIGVVVGPIIIRFATHPVTNLVIGVVFLVFALSLFGLLTLQPPAFLMRAAGSASQKGGYLGVFLMGATLVVTSFTCTAPFVGTLLSTGATSGGIGRIALGMGVFGLTMAVPFVFLSMVPGKVKAMPKSGEWMHTLKVYLGFVEVAAALKFLSNTDIQWQWGVISREMFLVSWAAIFFMAGAYLFAWIRLRDEYGQEEAGSVSPKRMVGGVATMLFAAYCLFGGMGHRLDPAMTALIPPYSNAIGRVAESGGENGGEAASAHTVVTDDYERALELARKENKLLLVNFTGFV